MGPEREQAPRAFLSTDRRRTAAPRNGNQEVESFCRSDRRHHEHLKGGAMSLGSRLRTWWRGVAHGVEVNSQLDEELQFHIESYADDLVRSGLSREEAMRRARAELGSATACRENAR